MAISESPYSSDKHGQVKLGIEAPEDVEIWREEIYGKREKSQGEP
jgi:carbon storage regulator CsrA